MFLVGLTGSIATGKSTVAKIFQEQGIPVVDADFYARKGSPELTSAFITLRSTHDDLFTKSRNSAFNGYSMILEKLEGLELVEKNTLSPRQLRKKWENLLKRYWKLKRAANSGLSGYGTALTFENWPYFKDMDQILVKHEPLTHMLLSDSLAEQVVKFEVDGQDECSVSVKKFRSSSDDCPSVEVVDTSADNQTKEDWKMSKNETLSRLVGLHEKFVGLYERLVIALEKCSD